MRRKLKKPFALLMALFILMTSVGNKELFVLAEGTNVFETLSVSEAHSEDSEEITEEDASEAQTDIGSEVDEDVAYTVASSEEMIEVMEDDAEVAASEVAESEEVIDSSDEEEAWAEELVTYEPISQPDGIIVKAYAAAGVLPEDASMMVTDLSEGSDAYNAAEEALINSDVQFDGFKAMDISFYDVDGNVIEPEDGAVQVQIELDASVLPEEADPTSVAVQHHDESEGYVQVETVADVTVGTVAVDEAAVVAEFAVESFSTFTLTWNNNNALRISCVDEDGNSVGTDQRLSITSASNVADIAPKFDGYEFLRATVGTTEIQRIRRNSGDWQYSTQTSGSNWNDINNNTTVTFIYRSTDPNVSLSQSVSGDTVTLTATTRNFTASPTLTWSISGDTDAVEFDPVNHTVTWKEGAAEGATVTVTVVAANGDTESATDSITLVNEFVTITYNPNETYGGSGTAREEKYRVGAIITVPGNEFGFTNTQNRIFAGWGTETYTNANETNKVYTPGQKLIVTKDMPLYAQWMDDDATVNHVHIRVEGLIFSRTVQITDGAGNVISEATQTFTGVVTRVNSVVITGDNWTESFGASTSSNGYEFQVGNFDRRHTLDSVESVVVSVNILGDDGTVLEDQEVEFTQEQIYAAWANCGGTGTSKGLDFNISDSNIQLEVQKIPARLIVTKDFVGLDENQINQLADFEVDVNGQKLTVNDPIQRTVTIGGNEVTIVKAIEADGSYMWAMTDLPTDSYTVTESGGETVGEYQLNSWKYVATEYGNSSFIDEGNTKTTTVTLGEGDVKVVAFTNTYGKQQADLTIEKVVKGAEVPEGTSFTFEVFEANADIEADNPVATIVLPTEDGEMNDTVKVEVGEYIVVESGGIITNYDLVSTTYTGTDVTDNENGTANFELPVDGLTVTCTNTYEKIVNDLSITKNAIDAETNEAIDVDEETYRFTVKGDASVSGAYTLTNANGTTGSATFTNGEATVEIAGAGAVVINDLPVGSYTVTEIVPTTAPDGYYYDNSTVSTGSATLTKDASGSVTITNKYLQERKIVVSKTVDGSMGDTAKEFTFTIKVNNVALNGNYGTMEITNGEFTLAHGENIEITGLKKGDVVEITEENYSIDGYVTKVNNASGRTYTTGNAGLTDVTTNVDYVNTKDVSTPTGIFKNIFPFIMMTVIAVEAAVVFFVMYMRRRRY